MNKRAIVTAQLAVLRCFGFRVVATILLLPVSSWSARLLVSPNGNNVSPFSSWANASTTIQAAIDVAEDGDTVFVGAGVYAGPGNRDLVLYGLNILLMSSDGPQETIIDCGGSLSEPHRAFIFYDTDTLCAVRGFTLTSGFAPIAGQYIAGGAVLNLGGSPAFEANHFQRNYARIGGALASFGGDKVAIVNCTFDHNISETNGGAIFAESSLVSVDSSVFVGNDGGHLGGAVHCEATNLNATRTLFFDNSAIDFGGALWLGSCTLYLVNVTIADNSAQNTGGALAMVSSNAVLARTIIAFNGSSLGIPVFSDSSSTISVICSDIYGNQGGDWTGALTNLKDSSYNIELDPAFCEYPVDIYAISSESPCATSQSGCNELIGARDVSCAISWISDSNMLVTDEVGHAETFPNPFNSAITFRVSVPVAGDICCRIFDALGRRVDQIFVGYRTPGDHQFTWRAATQEFGSGVYFYQVTFGQTRTLTGAIVLMK